MRNTNTIRLSTPREKVLLLEINRTENANSINTELISELEMFFRDMVSDVNDYRCIVITGSGGKIFCAGGDLKERNSMNDKQWADQHAIIERAFLNMLDCPIPIIAAVNGPAIGGGCELALNCDFIYASEKALFALTETSLGIIPGAGGTQNLPRLIGEQRAKEILFTADKITAKQAYEWGMVNKIFAHDDLLGGTLETAEKIASNAPLAVKQAKKSVVRGMQMDKRTGMFFEVEAYNRLISSEDRYEGVKAFNEKRKPEYKGR